MPRQASVIVWQHVMLQEANVGQFNGNYQTQWYWSRKCSVKASVESVEINMGSHRARQTSQHRTLLAVEVGVRWSPSQAARVGLRVVLEA